MYTDMYTCPMSKKYSIAEARAHLPTIVDRAEAGAPVELTRRGKPVAVVVSLREFERLRGERPRFSDAYKVFLKRYALREVGLEEDWVESLREKGIGRRVSL
jgi:prevent-host-death family protein